MQSLDLIYTCNGDITVLFWIIIPLMMQQVAIQLKLLVCNTKARAGLLYGRDAFDKLGCWQDLY